MDRSFERLTLPARVESVRVFHQFVRSGAEAVGLGSADMNKLTRVAPEMSRWLIPRNLVRSWWRLPMEAAVLTLWIQPHPTWPWDWPTGQLAAWESF
jgi:hypothetical protein